MFLMFFSPVAYVFLVTLADVGVVSSSEPTKMQQKRKKKVMRHWPGLFHRQSYLPVVSKRSRPGFYNFAPSPQTPQTGFHPLSATAYVTLLLLTALWPSWASLWSWADSSCICYRGGPSMSVWHRVWARDTWPTCSSTPLSPSIAPSVLNRVCHWSLAFPFSLKQEVKTTRQEAKAKVARSVASSSLTRISISGEKGEIMRQTW